MEDVSIDDVGQSEQGAMNRQPSTTPSLRVFAEGNLVFSSFERWLHPLFDLEEFLTLNGLASSAPGMRIEDKIIGKAAAFLIVRMGFRQVYGETMSRLAQAVFEAGQIAYSYGKLVERIDCATESLLADIDAAETAYSLIAERAGR